MFSFFKAKPTLKEIIPSNYTDIHSHLIYGIDDGAKTADDSKQIIDAMQSFGFSQAIATPHTTPLVWDNTKEGILNKHAELCTVLSDCVREFPIRVASEYMMDESFLKRIEQEPLLTLKDNYVLVEMSYINPPIQLFDILFALKSNGYEIVLAHPERYNFYHNNPAMYEKLKKAGCFFQMNLLSTTGYYGGHVLQAANHLLKQNLIDFTGSDIHHKKHLDAFESKIKIKDVKNFEQALLRNEFFSQ